MRVNARRRKCAVHLHTQIKCVGSTQRNVVKMCQYKRSIKLSHSAASHLPRRPLLFVSCVTPPDRLPPTHLQKSSKAVFTSATTSYFVTIVLSIGKTSTPHPQHPLYTNLTRSSTDASVSICPSVRPYVGWGPREKND